MSLPDLEARVAVLLAEGHDESLVLGVFATVEAAQRFAPAVIDRHKHLAIEEWELGGEVRQELVFRDGRWTVGDSPMPRQRRLEYVTNTGVFSLEPRAGSGDE